MEDPDQDLVARCQGGDLGAFESLVKRYQPRILAFLQRQVGCREDAEDVTQRTFLQAYQSLDRFDPRYRFSPWLFTIARRQGIDFLRHSGSRRKTHEQLKAQPPPANGPDPSSLADQKEEIDHIWRWVWANLDSRSREILWLSIQEDLDLAEVARVMKLTRAHVKVLLFRARKSLRQSFSKPRQAISRQASGSPASSH